jgi:hypothetical protein
MTLPEGVNWTNVILALLGIAVLCVVWIVANFALKMTIKMFALGCLGILVVGVICAAVAWFSGGG